MMANRLAPIALGEIAQGAMGYSPGGSMGYSPGGSMGYSPGGSMGYSPGGSYPWRIAQEAILPGGAIGQGGILPGAEQVSRVSGR
jgi:hypothetical protein